MGPPSGGDASGGGGKWVGVLPRDGSAAWGVLCRVCVLTGE